MSTHRSDDELIARTRNTARFFVEQRSIGWVLLGATLLWGVFGYVSMPKRKDPEIQPNIAVAMVAWPGASAERIEQYVTRKLEERISENTKVERVQSISRSNLSIAFIVLDERVKDRQKEFDDIGIRLQALQSQLPEGAQPITYLKDFGDTAALMLTVASPKVSDVELSLRAKAIREAIRRARANKAVAERTSIVVPFSALTDTTALRRARDLFGEMARDGDGATDLVPFEGAGFIGLDGVFAGGAAGARRLVSRFVEERVRTSELHPDVWRELIVLKDDDVEPRLREVAGDKYSYRDLDRFTDLIRRSLQTVPLVSKVTRAGMLDERVFLEYSQERLAALGMDLPNLRGLLSARNAALPGGAAEAGGRHLSVDPSTELRNEKEIGDVMIGASAGGAPMYLRDIFEVRRGYESPARYLNYHQWRDERGAWHRARAITLAVQMRSREQIGQLGTAIDQALATVRERLPGDLVIARTSDQPRQVADNIALFMKSLWEAIALVVLVSLIGFREWRSALLMALSIPLTLAMTFGMMHLLGVDLQQVSIASLIIALGLLVDDPVVAGDAIKRELVAGKSRSIAAWLGPTKLAKAILFATITNIAAYLPFLILDGNSGQFVWSLPIVIGSSLVASRIVSMTFIPLLGYYLLRPGRERLAGENKTTGFAGFYYRTGRWALRHRFAVLGIAFVSLGVSAFIARGIKQEFFPKDYSHLAYIDVWLPVDATLASTNRAAREVETVVRETAEAFGRERPAKDNAPREILESLTTFLGGGGPRFWFSVTPELQQLNYAQIILQVKDKHDTSALVAKLQHAVSSRVAGARVDVRQLETNPVGVPIAIRLSGHDVPTLRATAERVKDAFLAVRGADRVRDDWGSEAFKVRLHVDADRANLAGITNADVSVSTATALSGFPVGELRPVPSEESTATRIPIVARLRLDERARLSDLRNLYVYSSRGSQKVPLGQVSRMSYGLETEVIRRRNHFRTVTVNAFSLAGTLPSEVLAAAMPALDAVRASLPPGHKLEVGGEAEEQLKGFRRMRVVLIISTLSILLALVWQFRSAVKPLLVFAAIPFGMAGAFGFLVAMDATFGYMAFLGAISLIGVIVSHVIVLFDFIEESRERGVPLEEALLSAGLVRLRPVLVTVGATVFGLVPLTLSGGPLWTSLTYLHIGGLTLATLVTLVLVPVLYTIFVRDLRIVKWETEPVGNATADAVIATPQDAEAARTAA
jgi:multidrug efflux pump subunit AcrB